MTLGWHFCAEARLAHGDDREIRPGEWLEVEPPITPCKRGLHLSVRALDALTYAPGQIVQRVEAGGEIVEHGDKLACSRRRCLWIADATEVLREFARRSALDVIHQWSAPDVVQQYLATGDESLKACARAAAWAAAWAAAEEAARASAEAAAWAAARASTWAATRGATWASAEEAAAEASARAATWAATRASAEVAATRGATWASAEEAARAAANARLESMLMSLAPSAEAGEGGR